MPIPNPLTPDDIANLIATKQRILDTLEAIKQAKQAGIDVTAYEDENKKQLEQVTKLLTVYGANSNNPPTRR